MTSKLTRERIEWLNYAATGLAANGTEMAISPQDVIALTECCLAAMDSEPVVFTDERNLHHIAMGRETSLIWGKQNSEAGDVPLYRHAQQPVVPEDVLDALQKVARIRLDLNDFDGDRRGIADCLGDAEEALIEVVNRRAAMLQELQKSAGVSNNSRSNENVQDLQAGNSPVNDVTNGKPLTITLPDISSKAFWSGAGKNETFHPETYRRWVKEAVERACIIASIDVEVK